MNHTFSDYELQYQNMTVPFTMMTMEIKQEEMLYHLYGPHKLQQLYQKLLEGYQSILLEGESVWQLPHKLFLFYLKEDSKLEIMKRIYDLDDLTSLIATNLVDRRIHGSFGICYIEDPLSFYQALDHAETARCDPLDYPKYSTSFSFFDQEEYQIIRREYQLQSMMDQALEKEEFVIYLQPKVEANNGRIIGAEALLRWFHHGVQIPLKDFMPIMDSTAFIRKIDLFVFKQICLLQAKWKQEQLPILPISVNISKASYEDGAYYLGELLAIAKEQEADPRFLEFELNEEILFHNDDHLYVFLQRLHAEGYQVSLDDFGTGNASLQALLYLDVDSIKLDHSFFCEEWCDRTKLILHHTLALLKSLRMNIVAEGVECQEQYEYLKNLGCDAIQGYYFYPPMPIQEVEESWKRDNRIVK